MGIPCDVSYEIGQYKVTHVKPDNIVYLAAPKASTPTISEVFRPNQVDEIIIENESSMPAAVLLFTPINDRKNYLSNHYQHEKVVRQEVFEMSCSTSRSLMATTCTAFNLFWLRKQSCGVGVASSRIHNTRTRCRIFSPTPEVQLVRFLHYTTKLEFLLKWYSFFFYFLETENCCVPRFSLIARCYKKEPHHTQHHPISSLHTLTQIPLLSKIYC